MIWYRPRCHSSEQRWIHSLSKMAASSHIVDYAISNSNKTILWRGMTQKVIPECYLSISTRKHPTARDGADSHVWILHLRLEQKHPTFSGDTYGHGWMLHHRVMTECYITQSWLNVTSQSHDWMLHHRVMTECYISGFNKHVWVTPAQTDATMFVFSACAAKCTKCAFASDGSSTCSECEQSYVLENNECKGTVYLRTQVNVMWFL